MPKAAKAPPMPKRIQSYPAVPVFRKSENPLPVQAPQADVEIPEAPPAETDPHADAVFPDNVPSLESKEEDVSN